MHNICYCSLFTSSSHCDELLFLLFSLLLLSPLLLFRSFILRLSFIRRFAKGWKKILQHSSILIQKISRYDQVHKPKPSRQNCGNLNEPVDKDEILIISERVTESAKCMHFLNFLRVRNAFANIAKNSIEAQIIDTRKKRESKIDSNGIAIELPHELQQDIGYSYSNNALQIEAVSLSSSFGTFLLCVICHICVCLSGRGLRSEFAQPSLQRCQTTME
jgi:hypothetical protein